MMTVHYTQYLELRAELTCGDAVFIVTTLT